MRAVLLTIPTVILLLMSLPGAPPLLGSEPERTVGTGAISTLRQAIEDRFGPPDRIVGEGDCLLHYRLKNGDTLTFVLADGEVRGVEHAKKTSLNMLVGKKVTLVGVYNGLAKASDQILMADGQWFTSMAGTTCPNTGISFRLRACSPTFPAQMAPPTCKASPRTTT